MPELIPGDKPKWTRQYVSPALDYVLREEVTNEAAAKLTPGDPHPMAKYEGFVFCGLSAANEKGQYAYYAKDRAAQESYNFATAEVLGSEWPEVRQTWVVTRAAFESGAILQIAAPPAMGYTWTFMESIQKRMPAEFDAVFVEVEHVWRDISTPRVGEQLDTETGEVRPYAEQIVPAGTPGQAVDEDGTAKEVRHINRLWSLMRTLQVAGLAGGGDGATRTWPEVQNYTWPAVLFGIDLYALTAVDGSIEKIAHRPIWLREEYSGPCEAIVTERWTKEPPVPPVVSPMVEGEIWFDGALLQIPSIRALHAGLTLYEAPGDAHPDYGNYLYQQTFPPTSPVDWQPTHLASFTVTPAFGGYLSRSVEIVRPTVGAPLWANVIQLQAVLSGTTPGTWFLSWVRSNAMGELLKYRVDINTKPDFTGSYLGGWKNKDLGDGTDAYVDGLVPGVVYYARVRGEFEAADPARSNTVMLVVEPVVDYTLTLLERAEVLQDGDGLDFGGQVFGGAAVVLTLRLTNTGSVALHNPAWGVTGADAGDWTAGAFSSSALGPGSHRDLTLTFDASAKGAKAALLTLTVTNAPDAEIDLECVCDDAVAVVSAGGADLISGVSALAFASINGVPEGKMIRITNGVGVPLTVTDVKLTGGDAGEWQLPSLALPLVIPVEDYIEFQLTFAPGGFGAFSAGLEIESDAVASPFEIALDGTNTAP